MAEPVSWWKWLLGAVSLSGLLSLFQEEIKQFVWGWAMRPNLRLGPSLVAFPDPTRPMYSGWLHVSCANVRWDGWRGIFTKRVEDAEAQIQVRRIGLLEPIAEGRAAFVRDLHHWTYTFRPDGSSVQIPVVLQLSSAVPNWLDRNASTVGPGTYLTTHAFIQYGETDSVRLLPGEYIVIVSIHADGKMLVAQDYELVVD